MAKWGICFNFLCPVLVGRTHTACSHSHLTHSATTEDVKRSIREKKRSHDPWYLVLKLKLIPSINTELSVSVGIVEHRDRPLSPVRYFTQADINRGKIAYRPPTAAPHLREIIAFSFAGKELNVLCSTKSGCWSSFSPGMTLVISILARACDVNDIKNMGICFVGTFQKFTQFLWLQHDFPSCSV